MATGSLLLLLDDIATLLDDVSVMTKVAAKKTAGVLGDDLALNAQQVSGVRPARELPVVWAVAKGSALNKLMLVPAALLISTFLPWLITPLLMLGGLFLCFEGVEKLTHRWLHQDLKQATRQQKLQALKDPATDLVGREKDKIRGAIRTDLILSAEIIVIALGTVQQAELLTQLLVLAAVAAVMTVGVYTLVAAIVKIDDAGLYLVEQGAGSGFTHRFGSLLLAAAPWLMKTLTVLGTAAMFLVGGGILMHGIPALHHTVEHLLEGMLLAPVIALLANALLGILAGAITLAAVLLFTRLRGVTQT